MTEETLNEFYRVVKVTDMDLFIKTLNLHEDVRKTFADKNAFSLELIKLLPESCYEILDEKIEVGDK